MKTIIYTQKCFLNDVVHSNLCQEKIDLAKLSFFYYSFFINCKIYISVSVLVLLVTVFNDFCAVYFIIQLMMIIMMCLNKLYQVLVPYEKQTQNVFWYRCVCTFVWETWVCNKTWCLPLVFFYNIDKW